MFGFGRGVSLVPRIQDEFRVLFGFGFCGSSCRALRCLERFQDRLRFAPSFGHRMLVAFHPQENCWFIFGLHGSCRIDWLSSETSAEATRQDRPFESRRVRSLLIVEFITLNLRCLGSSLHHQLRIPSVHDRQACPSSTRMSSFRSIEEAQQFARESTENPTLNLVAVCEGGSDQCRSYQRPREPGIFANVGEQR